MRVHASHRATWRVFGVLMAGALVGVVGILPYALTLLDELPVSVEDTLPSRVDTAAAPSHPEHDADRCCHGARAVAGSQGGPRRSLALRSGERRPGSPVAPAGAAPSQRRAGSAGRCGHRAARPLGVRAAAGRGRQRHCCPSATGLARATGLVLRCHPRGAADAPGTDDRPGLGRCPADPDLGSSPRSCVDRDCDHGAALWRWSPPDNGGHAAVDTAGDRPRAAAQRDRWPGAVGTCRSSGWSPASAVWGRWRLGGR